MNKTTTPRKECKLPIIIKEQTDKNAQCELIIKIEDGITHHELKGSLTFTEAACMLYELEIMKQELLDLEFEEQAVIMLMRVIYI